MKLHLPSRKDVTLIENTFIDQYMPDANGEFVKLYLYLLRCAGSGKELSISSIADVFDHTEKDVQRALTYWEKLNLLSLQYDQDGALCDIQFLDGSPREETSVAQADSTPVRRADQAIPSGSGNTSFEEDAQLRQLIFVAEQYFARPLTSTEQADLLYFYDTLHFSADLIEYLIEYCLSKGSNSPHYMEKVAHEWHREGISTVAEAKKNTNLYNKNYYAIFHSMGMKGRGPAPAETEYMDRWLNEYGFSLEIIQEACSRAIRQTHQPNFQYADKVLEQWHAAGVRHLSDIQALDSQHAQSKKQARAARQSSRAAVPNRFNNFPQREYNWDELEQQLLCAQHKKEG